MTAPVFVDTNVLVYRHDGRDQAKQARAEAWYQFVWRLRLGRLSFQVLQELYSVLTRKLVPKFDLHEARALVRDLAAWQPVAADRALLERSWSLQDRYSLSWWDALIVAVAQAGDCRVLLTEDLQHGQMFGTLRVIDPFASPERTPAELLSASGSK